MTKLAAILVLVLVAGCAPSAANINTAVPQPTYTPYPTFTPYPTYTPQPTHASTIIVTADHLVVVTQLVIITATPLPATNTPAATDTAVASATAKQKTQPIQATSAPQGAVVYDAYLSVQQLASLNDTNVVRCQAYVDTYNHIASLPPTYDNQADYAWAIAHVLDTSRDEKLNCDSYLAGTNTSNVIPFQQWGMSRQGTEDARQKLRPLVIAYGFTP